MKRFDNLSFSVIILLLIADVFAWYWVAAGGADGRTRIHFLDVGQGDSELVVLPDGARILIDAGPAGAAATRAVRSVLPGYSRHIDLGMITHPQLDHFGGFLSLLDYYDLGAIVFNGREDGPAAEWTALAAKIKERGIPLIVLGAEDSIRQGAAAIDILSPNAEFAGSGELNDTGLVALLRAPALRALFAADTGFSVENYLRQKFDLRADVLKISHHGSRYSSAADFLEAVRPKVAVAEVGAGNNYGHPTQDAMARIKAIGAAIFRTDQNGTVSIVSDGFKLGVFTGK